MPRKHGKAQVLRAESAETWALSDYPPRVRPSLIGRAPTGPIVQAVERDASTVRSASRALTSDSRNLRCPPGVRIDPMRPADAHLVTVFGSTLNMSATSPGVSNRSEISMVTCHLQFGPRLASCAGLASVHCATLVTVHRARCVQKVDVRTLCPDSTLTTGLVPRV